MPSDSRNTPFGPNDPRASLPDFDQEGTDDRTIADPALGYGMERVDMTDGLDGMVPEQIPYVEPDALTKAQAEADEAAAIETLSYNEVAAVSTDREFYVSDVPSPYLSSRQAYEDVRVTRRRHSIIVTIGVIALVGAILGTGGWFLWQWIKPAQRLDIPEYKTTAIEFGEFLDTIDSSSLVQPVSQQAVTSEISGTIVEVLAQDGAVVEQGAVLFTLDNATIRDAAVKAQEAYDSLAATVDAKQEAFDKAEHAVNEAELDLYQTQTGSTTTSQDDEDEDENTEDEDDEMSVSATPTTRTTRTKPTSTTAAEKKLESAKSKATIAKNELEAAQANLDTVRTTLDRAMEQQEMLTVRAPVAGTISDLSTEAVPSAQILGSTRLCVVSDLSRLSIQVQIPDASVGRVFVGQEVRIAIPSLDLNLTSTVDSVNTDGDFALANIVINEPDERLTVGTAAEVSIILQSRPDSLMVPLRAVQTNEDGSAYVQVLIDKSRGIVADIPVNVEATNGRQAAITGDNLQEDTTIVLPEGQPTQ